MLISLILLKGAGNGSPAEFGFKAAIGAINIRIMANVSPSDNHFFTTACAFVFILTHA